MFYKVLEPRPLKHCWALDALITAEETTDKTVKFLHYGKKANIAYILVAYIYRKMLYMMKTTV